MTRPRALVIGASGGIGRALADGLAQQAHDVTRLSRRHDGLDICNEDSVAETLGRLEAQFDRVVVATGILADTTGPEKTIKALSTQEMARVYAVNAIGPMLVLKHAHRLLRRDRQAVFAVMSARVGSIGDNRLGGWYSYRASKAALNQLIRTASIELTRSHKQAICVALHPGTVETAFTRNYRNHATVPAQQAAANLLGVIDSLSPGDSGRFVDWAGRDVPW